MAAGEPFTVHLDLAEIDAGSKDTEHGGVVDAGVAGDEALTPVLGPQGEDAPDDGRHGVGHELALELLDDVRRLDQKIKESHRRIRTAVRASKTTLTELFGVGPIVACAVIGYTGDIRRFANRDHFAAHAGVAPIEHSSGGRVAHRLSRRGNRKLNNAIHIAADPRPALSPEPTGSRRLQVMGERGGESLSAVF
jgi:transposase